MNISSATPAEQYRQRLAFHRARQQQLEARLGWFGNARFALVPVALVMLWLSAVQGLFSFWWLLIPAVAFFVLSFLFERARGQVGMAERMAAFHDMGLARLEDRWMGHGVDGQEYLNDEHLYAADLDLFGKGSLYERLCEAQTRSGRDTLAHWLLTPAKTTEVRERQQAVTELRDQLDWRERLALLAAGAREGIDTAGLVLWGQVATTRPPAWLSWAARGLVALSLAMFACWYFELLPVTPLMIALGLQLGFALYVRPRVLRALHELHGRSRDLLRLSRILTSIERQFFTSPRLVQLKQALLTDGEPPSLRLAELVRFLELFDSTRNSLFGMIAPLLLWTTQVALAVEGWRAQTGPALKRWLEVVGEVEALTSLAGYAFENPSDPFPDMIDGSPCFVAVGLGHPLLPQNRCVVNDVSLGDPLRLLIVSGSNMSGKSTFLRSIGVNAVLAQAGAPVRASRLRLSPLAPAATLRIQDSLQGGKSRFFAEITRLQKIVALSSGPLPVLFLLDEVLHGTNSHDRRIGAEAILKTLLTRPSLGLATTHDLALAEVADRLAPVAANVHFSDELVNGELHFDYKLRPGVVQHSNALALMRAVGLSVHQS